MELTVRDSKGDEVERIEVDDSVFGLEPNNAAVHQALLAQLANRRNGSASTKTRGEVSGSTAKLRRQKGTGRARLGSIRSPVLRHGGVAFGPKPRSFKQRIPKRMRRLAIRSVLSAKAADGSLQVVKGLGLEKPRTKDVASLLGKLGLQRSTLLVTGEPDRKAFVSARNLPEVEVLSAPYLNVGDMLSHRNLVMTVDAVREAERLWGGERALRRRAPVPAPEPAAQALPASRARRRPAPSAAPAEEAAAVPTARRRPKAAVPAEEKAPPATTARRRPKAAAPVEEKAPPATARRRPKAAAPVEEKAPPATARRRPKAAAPAEEKAPPAATARRRPKAAAPVEEKAPPATARRRTKPAAPAEETEGA
jgi:large subunit ribosomal protein L4